MTWLEPCPDAMLEGLPDAEPGPEARYEAREAISLAFAEPPPDAGSAREKQLIERLTRAYETGDVDGIIALFTDDAWLTMPPTPLEYQGRDPIARFLTEIAFRDGRTYRLVPTRANGQRLRRLPERPATRGRAGQRAARAHPQRRPHPRDDPLHQRHVPKIRTGAHLARQPVSIPPTPLVREKLTATGDYTNQVHLSASPERVFEILTTAAEFTAWWAPAAGSAAEGGELRITFDGLDDPLVLRVRQRRNAEIRSPVTGHRSPHRRVRCPVPPSLTFGLRLA